MDSKTHDKLALTFIRLEESCRGLPRLGRLFDTAKQVINAAPRRQDASGDWVITTPAASRNITLHATALSRAFETLGINTSPVLSHSNPLQDIANKASSTNDPFAALRPIIYDQVEFKIRKEELMTAPAPK